MKNRYIINFKTSENTIERSVLMIVQDKNDVENALAAEFEDLEEELRIISICEDNTKKDFVLDF